MATRTARKRKRAEERLAALPWWKRLIRHVPLSRIAWVAGAGLAAAAGLLLLSELSGGPSASIVDPVRNEKTSSLSVMASAGRLAPNFEATTLDGRRVRLSDLQGKVVLVNFYASWCTACRQEIPAYQRIYDRYRDQGFEVLAVNNGESKGVAESYLRSSGGRFSAVLDPDRVIVEAYRVRGMPVSVFIDRDGVVVQYVAGEAPEASVERLVAYLVSVAPTGGAETVAPASTPAVRPGE